MIEHEVADTGRGLQVPASRHPGTRHFAPLFAWQHLTSGRLQYISQCCADLAQQMVEDLNDGPELTAGLRKLLEAKDCFVRQGLFDQPTSFAEPPAVPE